MEEAVKIAVVGAGGVGGGFGVALAKAGADVTFIARGAHLAAMQDRGLKVTGGRGETLIFPTKATNDPKEVGIVDVVLFCVKLWDLESAGAQMKPLIGPTTGVILLQNGIDAAERLIPILGQQALMGGVAQISASIIEPGVVLQMGSIMRMIFGEFDGKMSKRGENFLALCCKAGFDASFSYQIETELWMKFIILAAISSMTAATRQSIGKLRDDPDLRPILITSIKEVIEIGRAKKVALPDDALDRTLDLIGRLPGTSKASMALDLERGNRLELPWLGGKVAQLGRELGVPTPTNSFLYALLKPYIMAVSN